MEESFEVLVLLLHVLRVRSRRRLLRVRVTFDQSASDVDARRKTGARTHSGGYPTGCTMGLILGLSSSVVKYFIGFRQVYAVFQSSSMTSDSDHQPDYRRLYPKRNVYAGPV